MCSNGSWVLLLEKVYLQFLQHEYFLNRADKIREREIQCNHSVRFNYLPSQGNCLIEAQERESTTSLSEHLLSTL